MKKDYLKKLCICAMLAALFVPLEWLASNFGKIAFLDNYQIPISCFPLILCALMFGAKWSAGIAIIGSFLSQLISAYGVGPTTPIWMAPTIIYAIVVALLYKLFKKSDKTFLLTAELFISSLLLSILNIVAFYLDSLVLGYPYDFLKNLFEFIVPLKICGGLIFAIIFAIITPTIIKRIRKIIKL